MNLLKIISVLIIFLVVNGCFGQKTDYKDLTFELYEIQIFTGYTLNGTHVIKVDRNGMVLKKDNWESMKDSQVEVVNFHKLVDQLEGRELKKFRKSYKELLLFIDDFYFKNYKPIQEEDREDTIVVNDEIRIRKMLRVSNRLGTGILIIDEDMKSHYFYYNYCEEKLDELIEKVNQLIPEDLREEYKIRNRCVN